MSVCGMTDSRNWDGNGDRQLQRVKDGGQRGALSHIENGAPEFFRLYITKARLISDDEISYDVALPWNVVGPEKALEFHPVSWTLKRQK